MAENTPKPNVDLTCAICVDVFKDPVSLPCSHSYCRECLQMFADRGKTVSNDENGKVEDQISCPVCRSVTHLGVEDVATLQVNVYLADLVKSRERAAVCEEEPAMCYTCPDDRIAAAVKVCTTCNILYCKDCCIALHPMRGQLKEHALVSVEEYLNKNQGSLKRPTAHDRSGSSQNCPAHSAPFSDFCFSCLTLICKECLPKHSDHKVNDIATASDVIKASWSKTADCSEETRKKLKECFGKIDALTSDVKNNEELHLNEIEKAFSAAVQTLDKWRASAVQAVKRRHRDRFDECDEARNNVRAMMADIYKISGKIPTTSSANDVTLLQNSQKFSKSSVDDQLADLTNTIATQQDYLLRCQEAVKYDQTKPRHVCVIEQVNGKLLSPGTPKFTETGSVRVCISETGTLVTNDGIGRATAVTDVTVVGGRHYWEFSIGINEMGKPKYTWEVYIGLGSHKTEGYTIDFGVRIHYSSSEYTVYSCRYPYKVIDRRPTSYTRPHRVGLFVDFNNDIVQVIDCNSSPTGLLSCFRDFKITKPLTPMVNLGSSPTLSVRLVTCGCSGLPHVLREMLERCDS